MQYVRKQAAAMPTAVCTAQVMPPEPSIWGMERFDAAGNNKSDLEEKMWQA